MGMELARKICSVDSSQADAIYFPFDSKVCHGAGCKQFLFMVNREICKFTVNKFKVIREIYKFTVSNNVYKFTVNREVYNKIVNTLNAHLSKDEGLVIITVAILVS